LKNCFICLKISSVWKWNKMEKS